MSLDDLKKKGAESEGRGEYAETWKEKEEGDQLAGTLKRIEMTQTIHGDAHVLTIEDEAGDEWALWLGKVLLNKFLDDAPAVGALVVITYKGSGKSKAGFTYKNYDVRCEEEKMGAFDEWMAARELFQKKQVLKEEAALSGSGVAPDAEGGLSAPF